MADPLSYRNMRVLVKPAGNEAEIAVSDFDSRKHVVLSPPAGALPGWKPPVDNAPEGERVEDEKPVAAPTRAEGTEPRAGRFSTGERFEGQPPGAVEHETPRPEGEGSHEGHEPAPGQPGQPGAPTATPYSAKPGESRTPPRR